MSQDQNNRRIRDCVIRGPFVSDRSLLWTMVGMMLWWRTWGMMLVFTGGVALASANGERMLGCLIGILSGTIGGTFSHPRFGVTIGSKEDDW